MKKLFLTFAFIVIAIASSSAQSVNATIAKARIAAKDCIRDAETQGLQIVQFNTLTPCGDGTYGGTVTFYAMGHCPGGSLIACLPVFFPVAEVTVGCGTSTDMVVCFN